MSAEATPKQGILEKEKARKEQIQQAKFQKELLAEQNKMMKVQNDKMKLTVEEQELSARSWKAYFEKMYYSLESEKLEPAYAAYQERAKEKLQKQKDDFEAFQKQLQEAMEKEATEGGEDHVITQEDLDLNPELKEEGVAVGDQVTLGPAVDSEGNLLN